MRFRNLLLIVAAAAAVSACTATGGSNSAQRINKSNYGRAAAVASFLELRKRKYVQASKLAVVALRSKQLNARQTSFVYAVWGDALLGLRQPRRAFQAYSRAIQHNDKYWYPYVRRSFIYLVTRRYDAARDDAQKAVELKPNSRTYMARGVVYLLKRQPGRARQDFNRAISLQPKVAEHWFWRGLANHVAGARATARKDYRQALRLDPFHKAAQRNLKQLERRARPRYRPTPASPNVDKPIDL